MSNIKRRTAMKMLAATLLTDLTPRHAIAENTHAIPNRDAELLATEAFLLILEAQANEINITRIEPFNDEFEDALDRDLSLPASDRSFKEAFAYSHETGREQAIKDHNRIHDQISEAIEATMVIHAFGLEGKQAKVRMLIRHVAPDMIGPSAEVDWDCDMTRQLLAEFAGMSMRDIEAIGPC